MYKIIRSLKIWSIALNINGGLINVNGQCYQSSSDFKRGLQLPKHLNEKIPVDVVNRDYSGFDCLACATFWR